MHQFIAFKKKIPTVDYQHGVLSKYYVLYNHNQLIDQDYKNYLSDYFLAWGSFRLSSYNKNYLTRVGGNPFFEKKIKEYKHIKKESKSILFISDGHTTKKVLQELVLYLNSELHDYKIFYKLRPEEYHTLNEEYSLFQQFQTIYMLSKMTIKTFFIILKDVNSLLELTQPLW